MKLACRKERLICFTPFAVTATAMDVRDSQLVLDQALDGYYRGIAAYLTALAKMDLAVGKDNG